MDNINRTADDYNELLLEAIDTVVVSRLQNLPYDRTIPCTVVGVDRRDYGEYRVSDGSITFIAYSDNKYYAIDSVVMVTIPNNDWTQKKYITGRYASDDENDSYIYVDPLDKVINLSDELPIAFTDNKEQFSLVANNSQNIYVFSYDAQSQWDTAIYNTIGVSAEFQSFFDEKLMLSGSYGLTFIITTDLGDKIQFELSTADMFGNPYAYKTWMRHSQAYTLQENFGKIKTIECVFQQSNNFFYFNGQDTVPYASENLEVPNILVKNIKIFLGANTTQIDDNTVKLYITDSNRYEGQVENLLVKHPMLLWYNIESGNKFIGFRDGIFNKQYAISETYTEETAEAANKTITDQFLLDNGVDDVDSLNPDQSEKLTSLLVSAGDEIVPIPEDDNNTYYWVEWYSDNEFGKPELIDFDIDGEAVINSNYLQATVMCRPELIKTSVYAIVWQNKIKYTSNTLTYENQTDISHVASNRDITLSIEHGANSAETYALYGEDCRLVLPSNATKRRYLNAVTTWLRGYLKNEYWENSIIEWRVPKGNSNLRFPSSLVTTTQDEDALVNITVTETDTYTACSYPFVYKKQIDDNNFEWVVASDIFYYNLKENYNPRATAENNTITCIITSVKNEFAPLTASVRFNFSAIGNSGTEYTITISPKVGDYVFTTGDSIAGDSQLFSYTLSDPSGKIVNDAQFYHNIPATFSIDAYNTVEAFVYVTWAGRRVQLSYEYPVQFSKNGEYSANAPIKVSYNAEGRLNNQTESSIILELYKNGEIVPHPTWEVVNIGLEKPESNYNTAYQKWLSNYSFVPHLDDTKTILILPSVFGTRFNSYIIAKVDGEVVWQAPIVLKQYRYNSEVLNNWTGETIVDTEGNKIFSNVLVAGKMNTDNTFDGVVLGEVGNALKDVSNTGLYGYKKGQQAYAFKDDGTAFIGGSGTGRISFDGNNGTISSQQYEKTKDKEEKLGVNLDLAKSTLFMRGQKDNKTYGLTFDENGLSVEGHIEATTGKIGGWTIKEREINGAGAWSGYLLQYAPEDTNSWEPSAFICPQGYGLNSGNRKDMVLYINDNFRVDTNGKLYASGAQIFGNTILDNCTINQNCTILANLTANNLLVQDTNGNNILNASSDNNRVTIANFNVDSQKIYDGTFNSENYIALYRRFGSTDYTIGNITSQNWRIIAGKSFGVTREGELSAVRGEIGGWNISKDGLTRSVNTAGDPANPAYNGSLTLNANGVTLALEDKTGYFLSAESIENTSSYQSKLIFKLPHAAAPGSTNYAGALLGGEDTVKNSQTNSYSFSGIAFGKQNSQAYSKMVGTWYNSDGLIQTSSRLAKYNISHLDDRYTILFDHLIPRTFKLKEGTKGRIHTGFILDEVLEAIQISNLSTNDFAAYCLADEVSGIGGLRYEEFISLCVQQIQLLKNRISNLENTIQELKEKKDYETN